MDNQVQDPVLDTTTPAEEFPQVEEEIAKEEKVDQSVYNCPDCAGQGLKDEYTLCPRCQGTGKI